MLSVFIRDSIIGDPAALALAQLLIGEVDLEWDDFINDFSQTNVFTFSDEEAIMAGILTGKLNNQIRESVTSRGAHFINVNNPNSPFRGHEICPDDGNEAYFNGLFIDSFDPLSILENLQMSFHPNANGARAYKAIFQRYYLMN